MEENRDLCKEVAESTSTVLHGLIHAGQDRMNEYVARLMNEMGQWNEQQQHCPDGLCFLHLPHDLALGQREIDTIVREFLHNLHTQVVTETLEEVSVGGREGGREE